MNLPDLSIKRPIFITCLFILILGLGVISLQRLGLDLFPNVTFPVITVNVVYKGAGPKEIETLISKPIEDELSTLSGIKTLSSKNEEGVAVISIEFTLDTDIRYAKQEVNDRVSRIRNRLPSDIDDPIIRSIDPADAPISMISITADLPEAQLYDLADQDIKPQLEQVKSVGQVEIGGGRKREIEVLLDEDKLKARQVSATQAADQIGLAGRNTPAGKIQNPQKETLIRTLGEFESVKVIEDTVMKFVGNEVATTLRDIGRVEDSLEDETTRTYVNGKPALTLMVYRQSGANTVAVADAVMKRVRKINEDYKGRFKGFELSVVRDGAKPIRNSVDDVTLTIYLGIALTVFVVLFFLGNVRSTLITGIALPNSLLGAFILMGMAGFTLNFMTLMALSLAVGLLIDDAIVVRENIFRRMELGESPKIAASLGAKEVTLAVVATTMTVLSVFGPVAFLSGVVGQFFKEFGLTICFAMLISLFDSLTMAPMLSAYFAAKSRKKSENWLSHGFKSVLGGFERFQSAQERLYLRVLGFTLRNPLKIVGLALLVFLLSFAALAKIPKTFTSAQETGEFQVALDMPAGASLEAMDQLANEVDRKIRSHAEVEKTILTTGGRNNEANEANVVVLLKNHKARSLSTSQVKELLRQDLVHFAQANPKVQDIADVGGAQQQPFNVNLIGNDLGQLRAVSDALLGRIKNDPDLKDVDTDYRTGKPELQVIPDKARAEKFGVSSTQIGNELRTLIEGSTPAKFRENGRQYDIRVRLKEDQRNLRQTFPKTFVPNVNNRLVRLSDVASLVATDGPATIYRQNRGRYIQISADINPKGRGMSQAITDVKQLFDSGTIPLPPGVRYAFFGQAQDFQDLGASMVMTMLLAVGFIYLVLSSLYESFFIPFAIMLVLPLAACGAFYGLFLAGSTLDVFSMIGCILLLGVASKNSILLVDHIQHCVGQGMELKAAILESGKVRLRPIMMTSFALIAGMLPVAIPMTEASKQRSSMGVAVIGGLISSTLLTLIVVPAAYSYIERFQAWIMGIFKRAFSPE